MTTPLLPYAAAAVLLAVITVSGCSTSPTHVTHTTLSTHTLGQSVDVQYKPSSAAKRVIGSYVSEGYNKRAQGYDRVAIKISHNSDVKDSIKIKVHSRNDIKKPTCQFNGTATLLGQDQAHGIIFKTHINDNSVFFQFKDDTLAIDSQDKYALSRFCSGGGSMAGEYQKLARDLDLD
nr:hypothetical protein [uncultured Psychrobacter sp.]